MIRMTLETWAEHCGAFANGPLKDSVVLCEKYDSSFFSREKTVSHQGIIDHVTIPAHEKDVVRTPYAQQVLRSSEAESVHDYLGTDLFLVLLRETLWFVKWRDAKVFVQVCGRPWKRGVKKDDYYISKMRFMYAQERREDSTYERVSDLCRRIFGLSGRHLKPRYVKLLPHLEHLRDHLNDDTPALQGRRVIPFSRIAKELWHYVKRITPFELFDHSSFNMRLVRWAIYQFVHGGPGRGINLRAFATMWRLKKFTRQMVLDWLKHLFGEVCVKWIRQRYYISERFCFNKETWKRHHRRPPERLRPVLVVRNAGSQRLRLVPKGATVFCEVRPLVPQRNIPQREWDLRVAQKVLQLYLPEGIVPNLQKCKRLIRESNASWSVQLDIRYAYDMINQDILWKILVDQLEGGANGGTVAYVRTNGWKTQVSPRSFPRDALISDLSSRCYMSKERLLEILREVIFENYVTHQGRTYRLERGIPQGSSVSQLLCAFYLYKAIRPKFAPEGSLLLRHVDDQLFLCFSKEECLSHLEDMRKQHVPWNWKKFKIARRQGTWCGINIANE